MSAGIGAASSRRWLLAAVVVGLLIRLTIVALVLIVRHDPAAFHTADTGRYLLLGESLARGEGFEFRGRPEVFRVPGLPVLVAFAAWMGHPTLGVVIIQAALGAITCVLCFLCGREVGGTRAGLAAAWLYALEPGQWAWSSLVLTETLFTTLLAGCLLAALIYVRTQRQSALVCAAAFAAACAYVRVIGYMVPWFAIGVCALIAASRLRMPRGRVLRDAAVAAAVAAVLLGAWHVRNGVRTGFWGFSTQFERAMYFVGGGSLDAREARSYGDVVGAMRKQIAVDDRPPSEVAGEMRTEGIARIARNPLAFASTYSAGIVTTLLHPGSGAFVRLMRPVMLDTSPSVGQMLTLGRLQDASALARNRGAGYWLVTLALLSVTVIYLVLFAAGAWLGRSSPVILLPCGIVVLMLLVSGGPDGDARRRAPLIPLFCTVAAPVVVRLVAARYSLTTSSST